MWTAAIGALIALLLTWTALMVLLAAARPKGNLLIESVRLLPDLLRPVSRLARDRSVPRGVRVRLWLLLADLALPIDLVPDFIPVLGYADDGIAVALVLRSVVRHAGREPVDRHWPGSPVGLAVVHRLARLPAAT